MNYYTGKFDEMRRRITNDIQTHGFFVDTGQWQSTPDVPMVQTIELEYVSIEYVMPSLMDQLQEDVKPNLPWAEDHFQERVSGIPYNPPPSAAYWPYAVRNHEGHTKQGRFSHTYPERLWGIQYVMADASVRPNNPGAVDLATLNDLVDLLRREPHTRQAFIPIWWPTDGKRAGKERVPCTLGYHFMLRDGELNCMYPMRSCDLLRHFTDDVYMACRLTQWIVDKLNAGYEGGYWIEPGSLFMHISSLHIFAADLAMLRLQKRNDELSEGPTPASDPPAGEAT